MQKVLVEVYLWFAPQSLPSRPVIPGQPTLVSLVVPLSSAEWEVKLSGSTWSGQLLPRSTA